MIIARHVEKAPGLPAVRNDVERPLLRWAVFFVIAALALAIRLPHLASRPMHTDEAVQAYLMGAILEGKGYQYSPRDLHGPAPLVVAWPLVRLCGARNFSGLDERMLRLAPALTGALAVLLFALLGRGFGTPAAACAAVLWSVASLPVYYSRYFIHETLFVTASLGLIVCGGRALARGAAGWGIAAGLCAGMMLGSKETALISLAAMGIAGGPGLVRRIGPRKQMVASCCLAVAVAAALFLALYSWGGAHLRGPLDFIESFGRFGKRAAGEGHEKPAWYYLTLLGGTPGGFTILSLALAGAVHGVRKTDFVPRFFAVYGLVLFAVYSAIPYKTPWLALNFWLPLSILAGTGLAAIGRGARTNGTRAALMAFMAALAGLQGRETWTRVFALPCDERNPYAYAHTGEDLLRLPERLEQWLCQKKQGSDDLRIAVLAADAWPLPWYLRRFPLTGYWQPGQAPGPADLYITSPETWESMGTRLKGWRPEYFGMRPEVLSILWTPPPADPKAIK